MKEKKFCALILAAGKGTRMKSDSVNILQVFLLFFFVGDKQVN
jgi:hypothetical protein